MRQPFELDGRADAARRQHEHRDRRRRPRERRRPAPRRRRRALPGQGEAARTATRSSTREMESDVRRRIGLEFDLRSALAKGQFRPRLPADLRLEDLSRRRRRGAAALGPPGGGRVQPDEFIPILEQTGQIREVGRWVLRRGLQPDGGLAGAGATCSTSRSTSPARQLDERRDRRPRRATRSSQRARRRASLIVEVTETALMRDPDSAAARLRAIKELGVRIAIDDFGTGYSLPRLPPAVPGRLHQDRQVLHQRDRVRSPAPTPSSGPSSSSAGTSGSRRSPKGSRRAEQIDRLRAEDVNEVQGFFLCPAAHRRGPRAPAPRPLRPPQPALPPTR